MTEEELEAAITRVRDLIADPAGENAEFSDAAVERALDEHGGSIRPAAIDLLIGRLGSLRAQFDVEVGDLKAARAQQIKNVQAHIAELRRSGRIGRIATFRSDIQ